MEDAKAQYPHLTQEAAASFLEIEATPEQWRAADIKAKANIDTQMENYKYVHKAEMIEGIKVMVIGATGSGKSATANSLIGHNWFGEAYSAGAEASVTPVPSVTPVTSEPCAKVFPIDNSILKANLVVCDTPTSWESQTRSPGLDGVDCYIIVINLATPRFSHETLTKINSLKGIDGGLIVESGRFMVALTHADSSLQEISLSQHLDEIRGDPLHTFLTQVAQGRVVAINNAAETEYQRGKQQMALFSLLAQVSNKGQVYRQPRRERASSFKEGFANVMSSAKRLGSLAVGEVVVKARARLGSSSESSVDTVHPPGQDGDTKAKDARSWSTSDSSVTTSQPIAQDVEVMEKDENPPPAQQKQQHHEQQQQQQQQQQQNQGEQEKQESSDDHPDPTSPLQQQQQQEQKQGEQEKQESSDDHPDPTSSLGTGGEDNQQPMGEEDVISERKKEQDEVDADSEHKSTDPIISRE